MQFVKGRLSRLRKGVCRLGPKLARELAGHSASLLEAVSPHVESLARGLLKEPGHPTPLTRTRHRKSASKARILAKGWRTEEQKHGGIGEKEEEPGIRGVHARQEVLLRPDVGTQAQFKKKAAEDLSVRLVALAGARLGRAELGARARRVAARADRGGLEARAAAPVRRAAVVRRRRGRRARGRGRAAEGLSASRFSTGPARPSGSRSTCRRCRSSCTSGSRRRRSSRR